MAFKTPTRPSGAHTARTLGIEGSDLDNPMQRLRANSVQENLSNPWLDHLIHADEELDLWTVL